MLTSVSYGDREIHYTVSINRQIIDRIRIHVHPNGAVEVESPTDKSDNEVAGAVLKRARWIDKNLRRFEELRRHSQPRQYVSGETHFYLGRRYQLKINAYNSAIEPVVMDRGYIKISLPVPDPAAVKRRLDNWYKQRAEQYFKNKLHVFSKNLSWVKSKPPLKLTRMTTQWGSCSPKGIIHLNPMLIKAPRECVDYVIIHELCHLLEHNHSKRFYGLMQKTMPEWQNVKTKLDGMSELLLQN